MSTPEDFDIEEYLKRVKQRWESALLSEDKNQAIRDKWDDRWLIDPPDKSEK